MIGCSGFWHVCANPTIFEARLLLSDRTDVLGGNHDVVEVNLAHMPSGCLRDVQEKPQEVEVQLFVRSPAKALEGVTSGGNLEELRFPFRVIPADGFASETEHLIDF